MNPNNLVCRTCLGIISEGKVAHNIDEENGLIRNVRNIREMIMFCVPEMDIYISISPVICEPCISILISVYNFKIRCLRVENAIRSYVTNNNLIEGSCVNLNNVVRQQIVEALRQKNWPSEQIVEYLDKHLCIAKPPATPANKPPSSVFRAISQKFNAPELLNSSNLRNAVMNILEPPPPPGVNTNLAPAGVTGAPPPYPGTNQVPFRPPQPLPAHQGPRFISVSRNLMPPPPTNQLRPASAVPSLSPVDFRPPVPSSVPGAVPMVRPQSTSPANMNDFQNTFLSALQLTSSAEGGREEAVLVKKTTTRRKRFPNSPKSLVPPQAKGNAESNKVRHLNPASGALCPVTGLFKKHVNKETGTGLRTIRKSVGSQVATNNNKDAGDDIIILDDDSEMVTQRVDDELLLMNFDVNDHIPTSDNIQAANPKDTASGPAKTNFRQITVRLPKIDRETLRQKLTAENVIDEIQSKRRKLVVKLNSSLPYLHTKMRMAIKVSRDRFFTCPFCKLTVLKEEELRTHYMNKHRVCSRCTFKTDRAPVLTQHINAMHPLDLKEALKKCEDSKEFHCYLCNFTGLSEFDLRDHRLRIHIKCDMYGLYKCPYLTCTTRNAIAYDINKHIEKVHDKLRRVQCPLCNYTAPILSLLKKHIESHSLMKIKCHLCDAGFKTSFSLNVHIKKKHSDPDEQSTSGMIYGSDLNQADASAPYNEDYRITLDALLPRPTTEPRTSTHSLADTPGTDSRGGDQRNLDEYEFALPSLGEMLCAQAFAEEASDQEGDCTIVSEHGPRKSPTRKRGGGRPIKTKIAKKRKMMKISKKPEEKSVDDPDDCMIVSQEIPIVDLSDDSDAEPSTGEKQKGVPDDAVESGLESNTTGSCDVIEIEDQNDNEDCVLVSDVAESSTQKSAVDGDDATALARPDDSETDTCSELSVGVKHVTAVSAVSGSETDTCSDLCAGDVPSPKSRSAEDLAEEETASDHIIESEKAMSEAGDEARPVNVELDASAKQCDATKENIETSHSDSTEAQGASEKEVLHKETPVSETRSVANQDVDIPEAAELTTGERRSDSLENADLQSGGSKCTSVVLYNKDQRHLTFEEDGGRIPSNSQQDTSSREIELETTKELEESATISEPKSPQESQKPSESVVIESSDEDSDDCTFVPETEARQNVEEENKDTNKSDEEEDSERVEKETGNETEVSDVVKGIEGGDSEECQENLVTGEAVKDKDNVLVVNDEVSESQAQENVEEIKETYKSVDEASPELVEKETLNEKDGSEMFKGIEGADSEKCQENLDTEEAVKDKDDVFVTNDEVSETPAHENVGEEIKDTHKTDDEANPKLIEKETLNEKDGSEMFKGIEGADSEKCQENLDTEEAVKDKDDVFVTNDEVSEIPAHENVGEEIKDTHKTDDEANPELIEKETLNEKEGSEVFKGFEGADSEECQENLDTEEAVKDKDDVFVTIDEVSETEAQENVEEEIKDTHKTDDKANPELIEKETLNEKEGSKMFKGIEGADSEKCQENLDTEEAVKDKDDVLVTVSEDTHKSDDEDNPKLVEKETLNKNDIGGTDSKEWQDYFDSEEAVTGDVLVTHTKGSETQEQENVQEEIKDTNKSDDEEDPELVEKQTLNKKEVSEVFKGIEGAHSMEWQELFDSEETVKDRDDVLVTNDRVSEEGSLTSPKMDSKSTDKSVNQSNDTDSTELGTRC